ncbi:PhoX family protein [Bowmanella yangjiangensis]|uniref:PhoX family phosphatase n=1 Tax=Bowmanella yangjiangensis TaxID=2811230 RepID=A0ABS3CR12_9ALTE|nr:PhoX family phosphatase [Bowmanella yangjiangensis]MBN7818611.1 PhoX family phosphatase [Bowmanella yangjiangensis]
MPQKSSSSPDFQSVLAVRLSRRNALKGLGLSSATMMLGACSIKTSSVVTSASAVSKAQGSLTFTELEHGLDAYLSVSPGYQTQVLVSWGDALFPNTPAFDPDQQTEQRQLKQFGYNNDFIGFVSLPLGSQASDRGLLVVNHEYCSSEMMFPGSPSELALDKQQTDVNIAAHGLSVVEIARQADGQWQLVLNSPYNRRITPHTPMQMTGPAAGSSRLFTRYSTDGVQTLGTYGNCAGGVTPWGTILTGEENVDTFFGGDFSASNEGDNYRRFGMVSDFRTSWGLHHERWDMRQNPAEPLHVGWVVEIDPFDPHSVPKKRTALGRFKHEGANVFVNADNSVVAYSGDDQQFEYLYRFISKGRYQPDNRQANLHLLDEGTLYCARFNDDGSMQWLPLVFGHGPLTAENGFHSQADVQLDCRKAADLLGATPMDRPEDVDVNPVTGQVYVMLTNNSNRQTAQVDGPNPRAKNLTGQVLELTPPGGDHCAGTFSWELMIVAGKKGQSGSQYHPDITDNGWLACPDNCAFDNLGNLWIATDGAEVLGVADGIWATEVSGPNRALTKRFLRTPEGAELCGPFFTPDSQNLFCSIQHPGGGSSFDNPKTRWPDFRDDLPPRPSVVVVTKQGGGRIGS